MTALFLALAVSGVAIGEDIDPPGRVGRLSYVQGDVLLQAADAGAPEQAALNRPLTISDRLMTESGSRAELSVGTAALRLDENTDLSIANLDYDIAQIELNSGTLGIHLRELREAETFEIDTPTATVLLLQPGDYRIEVEPQGATVLAVRTGDAELDNGYGPIRVRDRQQARLAGDEQFADVHALGPLDAFDDWCIERERAIADAQATRYVSRDVVGYEELDSHGTWWSEPGYGAVWAPTVVIAGWAPYRFGHWTWISPWGWTWIDHARWGFAPFHYGRWAFLRHRWCWVPPRHHRPVWAPGLVVWKGGFHKSGPVHGAVSWFPLGPRDVHVPLHRASPRYLRNVNVSNTTIDNNAQITNVARNRVRNIGYANRDLPDALTSLPSNAFVAHRAAAPQPRLAVDERRTVPRMPTDRRSIAANGNRTRMTEGAASFARPLEEPQVAGKVAHGFAVRAGPLQQTPVLRQSTHEIRLPSHREMAAPRQIAQSPAVRINPEARSVPAARNIPAARSNPVSRTNPVARSAPAPRNDSATRSSGAGAAPANSQGQRAGFSGRSNSSTSRAQSGRTGISANRP